MRKLFGVWLLVAAGCTMPAGPDSVQSDPPRAWPGLSMPVPPPPVPAARVGVEYLPPAAGTVEPLELATFGMQPPETGRLPTAWRDPLEGFLEPVEEVRVLSILEDQPDGATRIYPTPYRIGPREREPAESHQLVASLDLSKEHISGVKHAAERMGLRFLKEVLGKDRRHVERTLGSPILTGQLGYTSPDVPMTYVDRRDQEAQLQRIRRYGIKLLRRPARRALKELRIVSDLEKALNQFKAVHIRVSGDRETEERLPRGHFSVHLGATDISDPMEIYYRRRGWKIGTGLETARVTYSKNLTDKMSLKVRSSFGYDDQDVRVTGRIAFEMSPSTTLNLFAGNDITVLTSPATYTGTPPDEDGSQGVGFYVEHMF